MTTTVKVEAHCAEGVRVKITRCTTDGGECVVPTYLYDGGVWEGHVYDVFSIKVEEEEENN